MIDRLFPKLLLFLRRKIRFSPVVIVDVPAINHSKSADFFPANSKIMKAILASSSFIFNETVAGGHNWYLERLEPNATAKVYLLILHAPVT